MVDKGTPGISGGRGGYAMLTVVVVDTDDDVPVAVLIYLSLCLNL